MVERSHWSDSTADVRAWLDALPLGGGGGGGDTAFAEALADAQFLLQQADARFAAPDQSSSGGGGGVNGSANGSANGGVGNDGGGGGDGGGICRQVLVVARSDPHRLAIPWPSPEDANPKVCSRLFPHPLPWQVRRLLWINTLPPAIISCAHVGTNPQNQTLALVIGHITRIPRNPLLAGPAAREGVLHGPAGGPATAGHWAERRHRRRAAAQVAGAGGAEGGGGEALRILHSFVNAANSMWPIKMTSLLGATLLRCPHKLTTDRGGDSLGQPLKFETASCI